MGGSKANFRFFHYFVKVEKTSFWPRLPVHASSFLRLLVLLPNSKRIDSLDGAKILSARGDDHGETSRVLKAVHVRRNKFDHGTRTWHEEKSDVVTRE